MYDVLIIGCGITGAAAAFEASKYQLSVVVLERENDVACGTTKANSAILHGGYDPRPGTLMAQLNVRGVALARTLCAALDVPYRQVGSLVVGFSPAHQAALEALYRQGIENGVPGLALLTGDEARALEPGLAPDVVAALHAPSAAITSPWALCLALAETAVENGVELRLDCGVTAIQRVGDIWRVTTPQGVVESRYILNAAGVSADKVHDMAAPHAFTISPSRGEYYLLDKCEGQRVGRVIFQCPTPQGKGVLVAPTVHGNLLVGPNAQPVLGEDTATTGEGLAFVRAQALRSVPGVDFRQSIRNFAGVRAVADTGDFILAEAPGAPGFFDLAGICSPGLSAAPAIGEYALALLGKAGLPLLPKEHFHCHRRQVRFASLSPAEKSALVAENPAYGQIICRCETISQGEILDALHTPIPPRSVDGVKRRVGAGMGRCQGGFCAPRVVALLAQELHLAPNQILQDGAGTGLLLEETKGGHSHV